MLLHSGISLTMSVALQEYLPRIKDNDVLRAVEKNTSGSRPKELFEEVLEDVDKQWETDRYCLALHFRARQSMASVASLFRSYPQQ